MQVRYHKARNRFRIIIPPSETGTGKREIRYFLTKEQAEAEIRKIKRQGHNPAKDLESDDLALLKLIKNQYAGDAQKVFEALAQHSRIMASVTKHGTFRQAAVEFTNEVKREKNVRTYYKYNSTLNHLEDMIGDKTPMVEITRASIDGYLDSFGPGTTRRAQYANVKRFINWSLEKGYLSVDPMAHSRPKDKWDSNSEPLGVEQFRRILFVVAGLETPVVGEQPTMRYFRLLPFYVLGGLCGMRRAEIISSYASDPVIEWRDVNFDRKWIHVRHEVAKQTGAKDQSRYIPLEPTAVEWLKMIPVRTERVMEISQSTLQRLNHELLHKLKIEVPENGLRNGYASWAATFRPQGELASAMGDLESTVKRYYITRREPQSGRAWFAIRPDSLRKIVPMVA
jgi:integrase